VRQSWKLHAGVASSLGAAGVLLSASFESPGSAVIVTAILVAIFQILKCIYGLGSDSCWRVGVVVLLAEELVLSSDPFVWAGEAVGQVLQLREPVGGVVGRAEVDRRM